MKKLQKFALLGVLALAGTVSFTSCSSEDDAYVGPDGQRLGVKTEFAISFANGSSATTRMTSDNTQAENNLKLGVGTVTLIPYEAPFTGKATEEALGGPITLTTPTGDWDYATENAHHYLYKNVDVPLGTSNFLAYVASGKEVNQTDAKTYGNLVFSGGTNTATAIKDPATLSVGLKVREETDATSEAAILAYLNAVADAMVAAGWNVNTSNFYDTFTQYTSLKAASGEKVTLLMEDLAGALANNNAATTVLAAINGDKKISGAALTYPTILPQGAIAVEYKDGAFVSANENDDQVGLNVQSRAKYVYPAALFYWKNTPIKTSTESRADDYGAKAWSTILNTYETDNGVVNSNTASIALKNDLQYAVARLAASVQLSATTITTKETINTLNAQGEVVSSEVVELGTYDLSTNGFELTGIVIGGQNSVNWQFQPAGSEGWAIYDSEMNGTIDINKTTESTYNHTLVLETVEDTPVRVALQLKNNSGKDIKISGRRIIAAGSTFYLVGELIPTTVGEKTSNVESGTTAPDGKVFKQDYVTKAIFTITPEGLNNATDVIPDLNKETMELGLSINLKWEAAATYNVQL